MSPSRAAAFKLPDAAPVFAALGDTRRLGLLGRLSADGPLSIARLSEGTGVTRQAITRHLDALGRAGLVRDTRRGRERVFSLDAKRLAIARQYLDRVAVGRGGRAAQGVRGDLAGAHIEALRSRSALPRAVRRRGCVALQPRRGNRLFPKQILADHA